MKKVLTVLVVVAVAGLALWFGCQKKAADTETTAPETAVQQEATPPEAAPAAEAPAPAPAPEAPAAQPEKPAGQ